MPVRQMTDEEHAEAVARTARIIQGFAVYHAGRRAPGNDFRISARFIERVREFDLEIVGRGKTWYGRFGREFVRPGVTLKDPDARREIDEIVTAMLDALI